MMVLLASSNEHKAAEFRRLFRGTAVELRTPRDVGVPSLDVPEVGKTFRENARSKALAYAQAYRMAALADDSGIRVDALGGAPGVLSARFGRPDYDDADRLAYLLMCMQGISGPARGAHYVCELVVALPGNGYITSSGQWYGRLACAPGDGRTGFGYDPAFYLPSLETTVSELRPDEKDQFSHRGKAVRDLLLRLNAGRVSTGTLER